MTTANDVERLRALGDQRTEAQKRTEAFGILIDAARYRWLRAKCNGMAPWSELDDIWTSPETLDATIDKEAGFDAKF